MTDKCRPLGACYEYRDPLTFGDRGVYDELIFLGSVSVVSVVVLLLLEHKAFKKLAKVLKLKLNQPRNDEQTEDFVEDDDVTAERHRIQRLVTTDLGADAFIAHNLVKRYAHNVPVKGLSMGVHHGECFGLLGVNGAGKTTTFRMITGDLEPTEGTSFIRDFSLARGRRSYQQHIGYCPQYDGHLGKLTGEEVIRLFGRLRGIKESHLQSEANMVIDMVDLRKSARQLSETYSGGNRRKLSLAMALIGGPPLLLLDEPTCGVDPAARRKIWSALAAVKKRFGCSMILT